jgi:hypothetical protein
MAAHRVNLPIGPEPFPVFIAFIAGDADHRPKVWHAPTGIEQVHRALYIGRKCLNRRRIRQAHQRLGRKMKNNVGTRRCHRGFKRCQIPNIALNMRNEPAKRRLIEQAHIVGRQRKPRHLRAHLGQPECKPAALEARMAGQKDAFA